MKTPDSYPGVDFTQKIPSHLLPKRLTEGDLVDCMLEDGRWSEPTYLSAETSYGPHLQDTEREVRILGGQGKIAIGSDVRVYKPGDTLTIPPNTLYGFRTNTETRVWSAYVQPSIPNPSSNPLERIAASFDGVDFTLVDEAKPPFWVYSLNSLYKHPELSALEFPGLKSIGASPKSWDIFWMSPGIFPTHIHYKTHSDMIPLIGEGEVVSEEWVEEENGVKVKEVAREWTNGQPVFAPWYKGHGFRVRKPSLWITGLTEKIFDPTTRKIDFEFAEERRKRIFGNVRGMMREVHGPNYTSSYD